MEKLKYIKPKLFSTMKTYTKEQFAKDIVAGIIVAIIALPRRILHLPARWQPRADRRSYRGVRCYHLRHHRPIWHDRTYNCYFFIRHHHDHHGTVPFRQSDQIHPEDNHGRLYIWYRHWHLRRTAQRLLRSVHGGCTIRIC